MTARLAAALAAFVALSIPAMAQNMVTLEGSFPSAGEFSIDPPNVCGYPNQDHFVWFMPDFTSSCGSIFTFAPPNLGGVLGDAAIDKVNDITWATDGLQLTGYQLGVPVSTVTITPGVLLPGPLTGIGFDSMNGRMWLTDGTDAVAIAPPVAGCSPVPAVLMGPITLPNTGSIATDIDWDSWSNTLWICDDGGAVWNVKTDGTLGPAGLFPAALCGLAPLLTGIAFDTATGTLFVTDGTAIVHFKTNGSAATPTFYAPNGPCHTPPPPGPPAPLSGLSFSPRPQHFGTSCATVGASNPDIGFVGNFSTTPNPNFGITLSNALPNTPCVLLIGVNASCPPIPFGACSILAYPFVLSFVTQTNATGAAAIPLPIPAFAPGSPLVGVTVMSQWLVVPPGIGKQTTDGLSFTISTL